MRIFQNKNISITTIFRTIKDCEQEVLCINLPKSNRPRVLPSEAVNRMLEGAKSWNFSGKVRSAILGYLYDHE